MSISPTSNMLPIAWTNNFRAGRLRTAPCENFALSIRTYAFIYVVVFRKPFEGFPFYATAQVLRKTRLTIRHNHFDGRGRARAGSDCLGSRRRSPEPP